MQRHAKILFNKKRVLFFPITDIRIDDLFGLNELVVSSLVTYG
jgi:hypothetical protein